MLSIIQAQQLHSYSAAYCQRSIQCTPASSEPLHLHAESAASSMIRGIALGLSCTMQVNHAVVMLLCLSTCICLLSLHYKSASTVRLIVAGLILALI